MEIGLKIKQLREHKGLKQIEVYTTIGMSKSYYSELEDGKKQPTIETLEKICHFYDISLSDFFKDEIKEIIVPNMDAEKYEILKDSTVTLDELKQALKVVEALKGK
jgi:transcriptional regulator with XRE-family HTH domain